MKNQPIRLFPALIVLLVTGCVTQPATHENCTSLECLKLQAQHNAAQSCVVALNQPISTKEQQAEIDALYGYPLRNTANYASFVSAGGRGPSPRKWCNAWAKAHMGQLHPGQR